MPYQPPQEYDFQIVFVPESNQGQVGQIFVAGGTQTMWFMAGWDGNSISGFQLVDSKMANENSTTTKGLSLAVGREYTSLIQVRRSGVKAYIDGKMIAQIRDAGKMTVPSFWALRNPLTVGVGANGPVRFVSVRHIEVSGKGKRLK